MKMKKIWSFLVFSAFILIFVSFVSAGEINFANQPNSVYNYGDSINTTISIVPQNVFSGVVSVYLNCGGTRAEVYKEFLSVDSRSQKEILIPILKSFVGGLSGQCNLQVYDNNLSEATSGNFLISNFINVNLSGWQVSVNPRNEVNLTGSAIKQDGMPANGFYSAGLDNNTFTGDVKNGDFSINFALPSDTAAGQHTFYLNVSEEDSSGSVSNFGSKIYFLNVNQVPTNVEVLLDNMKVMPGSSISGKIILHDQTGKNIAGQDAYIAVKDSSGNIIDQIVTKTGNEFSYGVNSTQAPSNFTISAYVGGIINSAYAQIMVNRAVSSKIVNNTLTLTNVGNVLYNGTLAVNIGSQSVEVPVSLGVGMSQKYLISAPDGEYNVSVGNSHNTVFLSGNAISLEKVNDNNWNVNLMIWAFIIVILALGLYLIIRRNYKRKFMVKKGKSKVNPRSFAVLSAKPKSESKEQVPQQMKKEPFFHSGKRAEISLSISGTKQNSSVGCISLKNYPEISSGEGNVKETLGKVREIIESSNGFLYQNAAYLFFILAPSFTKTFKNQKEALSASHKIKKVLDEHNKKFRKKIEYGISLNYGSVITKPEHNVIKFMSLGTIMISAKKIANSSNGEILLSESFKGNLDQNIKSSLIDIGGMKAYRVEGVAEKEGHSTFISGFLARQEKERQKLADKEKSKNEEKVPEESDSESDDADSLI